MSSNLVNPKRIKHIKKSEYSKGNLVYWMSRDQRAEDNWALLRAQELAKEHGVEIEVVFCLRKDLRASRGTARMLDFILEGLKEVEESLTKKNIKFSFLIGDPEKEIPVYIDKNHTGYIVSDFSPLRVNKYWYKQIKETIDINFEIVDAHNIVPVWEASEKQEYAAQFFRKKINKELNKFLVDFPDVEKQNKKVKNNTDWKKVRKQIKVDEKIKLPNNIKPGSKAALKTLENFIDERIKNYVDNRNDPNKDALSGLSPYFHFGQIAPQRVGLEVRSYKGRKEDKEAFLEEMIVRRELSDNFCYYNKNYDNWKGLPDWAQKTLTKHKDDKRDYVYSYKEFEKAKTHDELWNAAQNQMVREGKMHGYMRMYWAKKILEWTNNPKTAIEYACKLNDLYEIDGRDPNGYVGVLWSIGGLHDRPWFERDIYGTVRYMNASGASKKFDTKEYIKEYS